VKKLLFVILVLLYSCTLLFAQAELKVGDKANLKLDMLLQASLEKINSVEELKGKVIMLEFWATWCVPCIKAFPHLNELKSKFKGSNFEIIAITYETEEVVQKLLKKHALDTWIGINEDKSLFLEYAISSIPQTFLVDKSGIIVERLRPWEVTEDKIKELLGSEATTVNKKNN
jgi:thiol-disulfide isomerase/thioredoxin